MDVDEIHRAVFNKRSIVTVVVTFVSGYFIVFFTLILAHSLNLPIEPVAATTVTVWCLSMIVFAFTSGRRARADRDRERARRNADPTPDGQPRGHAVARPSVHASMRTIAARRGREIMAVMFDRPWWRGGWAYSAAARLGVDSEALAAANRGLPPAPARLRSRSALLGIIAGVGTYSMMWLVVSGMLAVPYYLLGRPQVLIWIGWLLVVFMLAFAWHVGALTRRLWLIHTLRREGSQDTDR